MPRWWDRLMRIDEKRWEKQRRMGLFGFVLVWGVGAFGFGTGIPAMTMLLMVEGIDRLQSYYGWWGLVGIWLLGVLTSASGGVVWGALMWWCMEWMYKRQLRKSGREPTPPGTNEDPARA